MNYDEAKAQLESLSAQLSDPNLTRDQAAFAKVAKEHKHTETLVQACARHAALKQEVADLEKIAAEGDPDLAAVAAEELPQRVKDLDDAEAYLQDLRQPKDPHDERPAIVEIRAGAGGDESSLFARELFAMYQRYADQHGWSTELLSKSESEAGGFKEVILRILGDGAYGRLKTEAGTHRVQRIPVTESGGRIHTSTVTVAVLPEAEESELNIAPEELRIDVFRSSGPGGQSVNTTDSAVRITHVPTGIVVSCQDEKSQHKNRAKAMTILRSRLEARFAEEAAAERGEARRDQIGSGDRSEKIRTYNFPQDRVTDHRIGYSTHGLDAVLQGNLDGIFGAIDEAKRASADR